VVLVAVGVPVSVGALDVVVGESVGSVVDTDTGGVVAELLVESGGCVCTSGCLVHVSSTVGLLDDVHETWRLEDVTWLGTKARIGVSRAGVDVDVSACRDVVDSDGDWTVALENGSALVGGACGWVTVEEPEALLDCTGVPEGTLSGLGKFVDNADEFGVRGSHDSPMLRAKGAPIAAAAQAAM
jgi:hypothetical protein